MLNDYILYMYTKNNWEQYNVKKDSAARNNKYSSAFLHYDFCLKTPTSQALFFLFISVD